MMALCLDIVIWADYHLRILLYGINYCLFLLINFLSTILKVWRLMILLNLIIILINNWRGDAIIFNLAINSFIFRTFDHLLLLILLTFLFLIFYWLSLSFFSFVYNLFLIFLLFIFTIHFFKLFIWNVIFAMFLTLVVQIKNTYA